MAYDRILQRMRECVRTQNYRMTEHAQDEAWEEDITAVEVENAVNSGYIINGGSLLLTVGNVIPAKAGNQTSLNLAGYRPSPV